MRNLKEQDIKERLLKNDTLFRDVHIIKQKFDILPEDKEHYGVSIAFQDIQELREDFINDLLDTIVDWEQNEELIEYYSNTIHKNYSLCNTLKEGVAYHHGKLPAHVRRTLEKAIVKKEVMNVVCTTTLLQGVNMPAQNVIIRNPHLYLKKSDDAAELSNYEMANLRGRAGRLLKDFIGRTYVLDESAFSDTDGYEQMELFEDTTKELPSGYEEKFEEYKEEIEDLVVSDKPVDETMQKYGFLVSYIRQSVLRYGKDARNKLKNVGIKLTSKQVAAIILK